MFNWNSSCSKFLLELGNVVEEESNHNREDDSGKKPVITCGLAEDGWVGEDGKSSGANCKEDEALPINN
jgi:hypothetical protein